MEDRYKLSKGFISEEEAAKILDWIGSLSPGSHQPNRHLSALSKQVNGKTAAIFDVSDTPLTNYIAGFQAVSKIYKDPVPDFVLSVMHRAADFAGLPTDNMFLQAVDQQAGGRIAPHYDAAVDGYVNYKCNVSVLCDDYGINIGSTEVSISQRDLYCFEASLYKHWTEEFSSRRAFISMGFIVPYSSVGRSSEDPRVRLSKRIEKYFQSGH